MANAYEARGSASEASGDEASPEKLKSQWTGGSDGWKRWKSDTGSSGGYLRKSRESTLSQGVDVEAAVRDEVRESSPDSEIATPMEEIVEEPTLNAVMEDPAGPSPPPQPLPAEAPIRKSLTRLRSDRSITPTPDRCVPSGLGISPLTPIDTPSPPHMSNMAQHKTTGINPYAALRRISSPNGSRLSSMRSSSSPEDAETRSTTSRRVTLRPDPVHGLFRDPPQQDKTEREMEMETQVASLLDRIKDLESHLDRISRPASPVRPMLAIFPEVILDKLGLGPFDPDDPLPKNIIQLPAYLFFVGVGVGAVMVRVIFGRVR